MSDEPVHHSEIDGMMQEADQDGDDKISFQGIASKHLP
jgi:hypothetical protein